MLGDKCELSVSHFPSASIAQEPDHRLFAFSERGGGGAHADPLQLIFLDGPFAL